MTTSKSKHAFSLIALAAFGFLGLGSVDSDSKTKAVGSQSPSYTLAATELSRDYNANEVAADNKYKGKVVVVSGTIQSIGKDITDSAYIVIGGSGFLDGVQCMFTKSGESAVAQLSKGSRVSVKGEVNGKMGNVLLRNCTLE